MIYLTCLNEIRWHWSEQKTITLKHFVCVFELKWRPIDEKKENVELYNY